MPDFVPRNDSQFLDWLVHFHTYVSDNQVALGLDPADLTPLTDAKAAFEADLPSHIGAHATAQSMTAQKTSSRRAAESAARVLARKLRANPAITEAQHNAAGIVSPQVSDSGGLLNPPTALVDIGDRLRHLLRIADSATPGSRAKPRGVTGCEVWRKIGGPPPAGNLECVLIGNATRSPFVVEYGPEHGNQTAHYLLRWVGLEGEKGPWSETISATVAA